MVKTDALVPWVASRLKYLTKIRIITIDNYIFTLHYRITVILLLSFSLLLACSQFFGEPIACMKSSDIDQKVINNFCWIESTFTLPKALIELNANTTHSHSIAHPGVDKYIPGDEVLEHTYYQWVSLVLFLQACCFYTTRAIWKHWEGGKIANMINDLNKCVLEAKKKKDGQDCLVKYLIKHRGKFNTYALRFFICEILNFIHIVIQLIFTNAFLGGEFSSYGWRVLTFIDQDPEDRIDPMSRIFPKMTKCTFRRFGSSGDVQQYDNLCILPLNILNEKTYVMVWFWFVILAIASAIAVIYRFTVIIAPRSRYFLLKNFNRMVSPDDFNAILNYCSYSDWFLLYLLSKNLDAMHYRDVISQLAVALQDKFFESNEVDASA